MHFSSDFGCDSPFCCSKRKQLYFSCCLQISARSEMASLLILGLTDGHKFTKINADWKSKVTGSDCKTNIWAVKLQSIAMKCIDGHWIKHHLSKCVLEKKHADISHKKMDVGAVNVWGGGGSWYKGWRVECDKFPESCFSGRSSARSLLRHCPIRAYD